MAVPTDQAILDALKTALHELATRGAASYTVNGRQFTSLNIKELESAIAIYERRVNRASRRIFAVGTFREAR